MSCQSEYLLVEKYPVLVFDFLSQVTYTQLVGPTRHCCISNNDYNATDKLRYTSRADF